MLCYGLIPQSQFGPIKNARISTDAFLFQIEGLSYTKQKTFNVGNPRFQKYAELCNGNRDVVRAHFDDLCSCFGVDSVRLKLLSSR